MLFYQVVLYTVYEKGNDEGTLLGHRQIEGSHRLSDKCDQYSGQLDDKGCFFLCDTSSSYLKFGLGAREIIDTNKLVDRFIDRFIDSSFFNIIDVNIEEITLSKFLNILKMADMNGYVMDDGEILRDFGIEELAWNGRHNEGLEYEERIISEKSKKAIYSSASRFFTKDSFTEELNRIYMDEKRKYFVGHPVDYMLETDDAATALGMTRLLLQALYSVGRLKSRRYSKLYIKTGNRCRRNWLKVLYRASVGGTIVIRLDIGDDDEKNFAYGDLEILETLCEIARLYRRDVLTIFCLPRSCANLKRKIFENMNGCTFVEICEELAYYDKAVNYLKVKAAENRIRCDKKLFAGLEYGIGYLTPELNEMFDEWYSKKLKNSVFKQYKDFDGVGNAVAKEKPKGSAYDELHGMVGLDSAKRVIDQALDSYKAFKLFKDKGIVSDEISHHMIFTGNPGTAKTTVARLFTRIMKDNGIIDKGQIVEVGRGDLVGKYVGWTAPIIQRKFKEAAGGVLFIDEAYSLVDDRDGLFGDEAINTIVQEMENHRGEVIVIFAGYPDKMEGFLRKNPGLRSRIAYHVYFDDYSPDELCEIAKLIAKQKGVKLDAGAMVKVREIMECAVREDDFGNGRFVRNVIEKAKMAQSSRLVHMDIESVTKDDVMRICAEDIDIPEINTKEVRRIGFVV